MTFLDLFAGIGGFRRTAEYLLFAILLLFLPTATAHAEEPAAAEGWLEDYEYTVDDAAGTVTLKNYVGEGGSLVIPGSVLLEGREYRVALYRFLFLYSDKSRITSIHVGSGVKFPDDSEGLFKGLPALESLTFGEGLDTSNVKEMRYLVGSCPALKKLDMGMWDTGNVTRLDGVFQSCKGLEEINLAGWDTSNVTRMYSLFSGCQSLKTVDLSGFDTSKVTNFYGMFSGCYALESLDLSRFDTHSAETFEYSSPARIPWRG